MRHQVVKKDRKLKPFPGSSIANRYRALILSHRSLEEKLADETKRPMPDTGIVQKIKKRKLALKEEIVALELLFGAMKTSIESAMIAAESCAPAKAVRKSAAGLVDKAKSSQPQSAAI